MDYTNGVDDCPITASGDGDGTGNGGGDGGGGYDSGSGGGGYQYPGSPWGSGGYNGGGGTGSGGTNPGSGGGDCNIGMNNQGEVVLICDGGTLIIPYVFKEANLSSDCGGGPGVIITYTPPTTPCEKTKTVIQNSEIQTNILYEQSKEKEDGKRGEKGFMVDRSGTDGPIIPGAEHSVHLGDITGYQGYYHNHTPKGVKMLSPPDIYKLFQFIVSQPPGTPIDASFGAMVAAQEGCWTCPDHYLYFTYMIRFNGTFEDAKAINDINYTEAQLETLKKDFEKFEQKLRNKSGYSSPDGNFLSFKGLEEVFFNALDDMNIPKDKIILQRIDKNGNVTNISVGPDGKPKETPCP